MKDKEPSPEKLAEMYKDETSMEIADVTGMSPFQVLRRLRKIGTELRPRGRRRVHVNPGKKALDRFIEAGYSQIKVAEFYDVSKRTVQRWIEENLEL